MLWSKLQCICAFAGLDGHAPGPLRARMRRECCCDLSNRSHWAHHERLPRCPFLSAHADLRGNVRDLRLQPISSSHRWGREQCPKLPEDHSINCDDPFHKDFQNLTSFFIVVYVAILPIAMLVQKSRQKEKRGMLRMLESPYKQSFWYFDSLDLYYRLSMTGFLMVVYQNSPSMRMVASLFVSFLMASIVIVRPFVNDSHISCWSILRGNYSRGRVRDLDVRQK